MIAPIDLSEKFNRFTDFWHPKIVGELNDNYVKLVKLKGEFVWHQHENEDGGEHANARRDEPG